MQETLQAIIDSNNLMYQPTGQTDYLKESQKAWNLLKELIKDCKNNSKAS